MEIMLLSIIKVKIMCWALDRILDGSNTEKDWSMFLSKKGILISNQSTTWLQSLLVRIS